ncbi:hypothetical protein GGR56DRAFT_655782, partial [Xylariaceae sp. FL0804]
MLVPVKASALVASSPFLIVASSALSTGSFECPVPVIPSNLGPSNACCSQLIQLPATSILNPAGNGNLYWGVNCKSTRSGNSHIPPRAPFAFVDLWLASVQGGWLARWGLAAL